MRWFVALLLFLASGSQAFAAIQFCNNFDKEVFFAVAVETKDGWVSNGWVGVDPKGCKLDPSHADATNFFWRGETDWFPMGNGNSQRWTWGTDKPFSVKDDTFTFKKADAKAAGARLEKFTGPVTFKFPNTVATITIKDEKISSTTIPREVAPGETSQAPNITSDPDYVKCDEASGEEALQACTRVIESKKYSGKDLAGVYLDRGLNRDKAEDEIADYDEAIRLDPDNAKAYNNRGTVFDDKGDTEKALADYEQAMRIDPNYASPYGNRGVVYENKGELDRAILDFSQAIKLKPDFTIAYRNRGDTYRKKGDKENAKADYEKALTLNPSDSQRKRIQEGLDALSKADTPASDTPSDTKP